MNELFTEKYRPTTLKEVAISKSIKASLMSLLEKPEAMPSLIFYSNSPGTGKTTTAKALANELKCDMKMINSSDERGIDSVRDTVNMYVRSLSSDEGVKRMVFLDEADGLTKQAQDALRNVMEECSDNAFFILSCNDINKIIEPIKSRCMSYNFENPENIDVKGYLEDIIKAENIDLISAKLEGIITNCYPDVRKMVIKLQGFALDKSSIIDSDILFENFYKVIKTKKIPDIYKEVFSKTIDLQEFNRFLFRKIFNASYNYEPLNLVRISERLADNEKYFGLGVSKEIIFMNNIMTIINIL